MLNCPFRATSTHLVRLVFPSTWERKRHFLVWFCHAEEWIKQANQESRTLFCAPQKVHVSLDKLFSFGICVCLGTRVCGMPVHVCANVCGDQRAIWSCCCCSGPISFNFEERVSSQTCSPVTRLEGLSVSPVLDYKNVPTPQTGSFKHVP